MISQSYYWVIKMKNNMFSSLCLIGLGVGGTILYQQLKNGNLKRTIYNMDKAKMKFIDDIEDMV